MTNLQLGNWNTREEAREFWDYLPYNECVYLAKSRNAHVELSHILAEQYGRNDLWLHIRWTGIEAGEGWNHCVDALLECVVLDQTDRSGGHQVNSPVAAINRNCPVFVDIPQFVELPEMMCVYGISSVARLKRVEGFVNTRVKHRLLLAVSLVASSNRKYNLHGSLFVKRDGLREQIDQIPSELVKTRAETVDEISYREGDLFRRRMWGDDKNVLRSVKIVFFGYRVRLAINPVPELGLGRLEVKVSPSGLHVNVLK